MKPAIEFMLSHPDSKRNYNLSLFGMIAPRYNQATKLLSFNRDAAWKRLLLKMIPPSSPRTIVDLACGTGDVTRLLSVKYPDSLITGIDISTAMLRIARQRNPHINFSVHDINSTGIMSGSVDLITGSYALRNAPELTLTLNEINRILSPDGVAVFLDFSKWANPVLQKVQYGILLLWGALWGMLLHGKAYSYMYIAQSLQRFPDWKNLHCQMINQGFNIITTKKCFFSMTEIILCRKKSLTGFDKNSLQKV